MKAIESPANWKSAELSTRTDWIYLLRAAEVAEMEAALKSVRAKGLDFPQVTKEEFPLRLFPSLVAKVHDYLENGPRRIDCTKRRHPWIPWISPRLQK